MFVCRCTYIHVTEKYQFYTKAYKSDYSIDFFSFSNNYLQEFSLKLKNFP